MPNLSKAAQVLLAEAAGEGPEGLAFVRDVMANRAQQSGKSLDEVALAPKQFSGASRPDLAQFVAKQPWALQHYAQMLVQEAQTPDYQPQYPGITHYVTQALYDSPKAPSWVHKMKVVGTVGNHVALAPSQ